MFDIIKEKLEIKTNKKKFMLAYNPKPDSMMHKKGCYSEESKQLILERNEKCEEFYNNNLDKDSLMIIIADHGHINEENIFLKNYSDIKNCILENIFIYYQKKIL